MAAELFHTISRLVFTTFPNHLFDVYSSIVPYESCMESIAASSNEGEMARKTTIFSSFYYSTKLLEHFEQKKTNGG